jgi:hypothetical protein
MTAGPFPFEGFGPRPPPAVWPWPFEAPGPVGLVAGGPAEFPWLEEEPVDVVVAGEEDVVVDDVVVSEPPGEEALPVVPGLRACLPEAGTVALGPVVP